MTTTPTINRKKLEEKIKAIVDHIDRPQSHFGLGVEHEGYARDDALRAILQLFDQYAKAYAREIIGKDEPEVDRTHYKNRDQWMLAENTKSLRNGLRSEQRAKLNQPNQEPQL